MSHVGARTGQDRCRVVRGEVSQVDLNLEFRLLFRDLARHKVTVLSRVYDEAVVTIV